MDTPKRTIYEFGDFILDSGPRRLSRRVSGDSVALTARLFDTLLFLIQHRGETVDKDTLLGAIWPGVIVEENSLTQNISALRQILGETPGANHYVATVPRRGYRFVGEVIERDVRAGQGEAPLAPPPAPAARPPGPPRRSLRPYWIGVAALTVLFAFGAYFLTRGSAGKPTAPAMRTLAVLPFKPLLPAERDESLELGMTESMIASLGARAGLTVQPLSSVRRYSAIEQDPLAAGRALNAEAVLDGLVQYHGDRLHVSVRLLRVADGQQLWANQFEGNVNSIFGVQDQISARVYAALAERPRIGDAAVRTLGATGDARAYLLYTNGRYALARSTEQSLALAISYFEQAIARDPRFALAHSGLADCYMVMGVFGMRSPAETFPRARDALLKALQIEPQLAAPYGTLGHIKMQYDRDWTGAAADFARAIALNPSLAEPHMYWGVLLAMRGEVDRGLEELKQAQRLEPLLTLPKTRTGAVLYFARRYDDAMAQANESLALDDRPDVAHALLGRVYLRTGRYDLALAEFSKTHGLSPGSFGDVGQALALSGHRAAAVAELNRVLTLSTQRYVSAVDIAAIYASLGDVGNTLAWLDRALQEHASTLGFLAQNPAFDALHSNPRFRAIVDSIGVWQRPLTP